MSTQNTIQQIYIGLLGRAADQEGLAYWTAEIDEGVLTLEQLRANIVNEQPEYEAVFGGQTRAQVVAQLYRNLFNREPDSEGLDYWVNGGGSSVNIDQLVLALNDGASAADRLVLDNRTEVANHYTAELGAEGSFDAQAAGAIIADVDGTRTSVTQAKAAVDGGSIEVPDANPGQTFTLTDAIGETVEGTAGNDTFTAVVGGTEATLNVGDQVLGGGGTDTINLFANAANVKLPTGANLSSIEVVNLRQDENVFGDGSTAGIDATKFGADAQQIWQINGATDISKLAAGQAAGFRGTANDATVTYAANVTEATIALDDMAEHASGSELVVTSDDNDLKTVNIAGSIADTNKNGEAGLDVNIDATVETLNLALESNTNLRVDGATGVKTFDASESTGGIFFDTQGSTGLVTETATFGSGADTLKANVNNYAADEVSISTGAGNDTFTLNLTSTSEATALSIDLGTGNDKLILEAANTTGNLVSVDTQADLEASLVTVAGLTDGADDAVDLSGLTTTGGRVLQADVNSALETATTAGDVDTLLDAAGVVAGVASSAADYALFEFGGNTYVFQNTNESAGNEGLSAGDTLVELTGVALSDLTGDNFVA